MDNSLIDDLKLAFSNGVTDEEIEQIVAVVNKLSEKKRRFGLTVQSLNDNGMDTLRVLDPDGEVLAFVESDNEKLQEVIVYAFKYLGIAARLKETKLMECSLCGNYHPVGFEGDCRDNTNRFALPYDTDDESYEEIE